MSLKDVFQGKVGKVMHEFKAGKLPMGKSKKMVKNRRQALAIAISEGKKASGRA